MFFTLSQFTVGVKRMAWQKTLNISMLVEAFLIFRNIAAHQCRINSYSVYQMMLKDHAYKTFKARPGSLDCRQACNSDVRCQSFNYVMLEHICELNDRTKEAQPEDFVKNSERYYVTKVPNRGKKSTMVRFAFRNK